jgi:hypothetical protein
MVNVKVKANFVKDTMRGDDSTEIKVELVQLMKDQYQDDSD